jgi:hypothetical protein
MFVNPPPFYTKAKSRGFMEIGERCGFAIKDLLFIAFKNPH